MCVCVCVRDRQTDRQTDIVDYRDHFLFVSRCSWSFPNRSVMKALVSAITSCRQERIQTDIDTPAARDSYTDVAYATVVTTTTTTTTVWSQPQPPLCGHNHNQHYVVTTTTTTVWSQPQPALCGHNHNHHFVSQPPLCVTTTTLWSQPPL